MEVIPGTHRLGLLRSYGSTVTPEDVACYCPEERAHPLEVEAGHAVLIHNWLIHRSGVNTSPIPRRAVTVCYMDGRTQSVLTGNHFPLVAGALPEIYPFVRQLRGDWMTLRESIGTVTAYARSLEEEVVRLRASGGEGELEGAPLRWKLPPSAKKMLSRVYARLTNFR